MSDIPITADLPELRLLAQLAGIAPSRMAAAFNDPEHFFKHMTLDELNALKASVDRFAAVQDQLLAAVLIAAANINIKELRG